MLVKAQIHKQRPQGGSWPPLCTGKMICGHCLLIPMRGSFSLLSGKDGECACMSDMCVFTYVHMYARMCAWTWLYVSWGVGGNVEDCELSRGKNSRMWTFINILSHIHRGTVPPTSHTQLFSCSTLLESRITSIPAGFPNLTAGWLTSA